MLSRIRRSFTWARLRVALYFLPLFALAALPLLALGQVAVAEPATQLDFVALINAIPLPPAVKGIVLFVWPLVYGVCVFLRAVTSPASPLGRGVRWVLDGVKHPDERAAAVQLQPPG
jgi:hypothetical protein